MLRTKFSVSDVTVVPLGGFNQLPESSGGDGFLVCFTLSQPTEIDVVLTVNATSGSALRTSYVQCVKIVSAFM